MVPKTRSIVRAYCTVQRSRVTTFFAVTKGLLALEPARQIALAAKIRARAQSNFFWAKEQRLANVGRRLKPLFWLGMAVAPHEVDRLELAIKRCGRLSTRQQSDPLHQAHVRRVYANSRDALIAQIEAEARKAAVDKDPKLREADQELHAQIAKSSAAVPPLPDEVSIAQLRRGLEILARLQPEQHAQLARWRGREPALLSALIQVAKGLPSPLTNREHDAALAAGRLGQQKDDRGQQATLRSLQKDDDMER